MFCGVNLYTYILVHDTGFAPNPFFGYCTLACCKPVIRRVASKGDWIVGFSGIRDGYRLIYAMEITEGPLTFARYFRDRRFAKKKPDFRSRDRRLIVGDNAYKPLRNGFYKQLRCMHSLKDASKHKERDLSVDRVLISDQFWYFGGKSLVTPDHLNIIVPNGPGHRKFKDEKLSKKLASFLGTRKKGILGKPTK